jgi:MFS family permease
MQTDIEQRRAERPRFINPNFVRLWTAGGLSGLGDSMFELTLTVWIATSLADGKSWSALAVTGLLVASAIPILLVGPIAGALIDRWPNKWRVMQRADLISAALILLMVPAAGVVRLPGLGHPPLWWRLGAIYLIVLLASVVAQFFRPASWVLLRDIVPEEERGRSTGYLQASQNLTVLIGPSIAPPLLFAFGAEWALLFNAATFIASYLIIHRMQYVPPETDSGERTTVAALAGDIGAGLRFFRQSQALMTLAITFCTVMIGMGAVQTLDVFFVERNLGTSAEYYGFLISVQGGAMIVSAIVWAQVVDRFGPARVLITGMLALSLLFFVYARLTSFVAALVVCVLFGLIVPAVNISMGPIMFRIVPREYMGRVNATLNPIISASSMIGLFGGGLLYSTVMRNFDVTIGGIHFGPIDTIFLGTGALLLIASLYALRLRQASELEPAPIPEAINSSTDRF